MGLVRKSDMKKAVQPGQAEEDKPARLSKTKKKNAALAVQDLGERLVKLSDDLLKKVDIPADVLVAVKAAKSITKHVPRARQMQYIGSLMRKCDTEPVREFLEALDQGRSLPAKIKRSEDS